jgi:MFS family permease
MKSAEDEVFLKMNEDAVSNIETNIVNNLCDSQFIHFIQNSNHRKLITRDEYLNIIFTYMPFTRYHFYLILSIFLLRTVEGTEVLSISLSSTLIGKSFDMEDKHMTYINLLIFFGNFIGCLLSIFINDKFPRKFLIKCGVCLIVLFGFISIISHNIWLFMIGRHFVNIGIGLILASSTALITESVNIQYRGFILNLILVSSAVGEFLISFSLGRLVKLDNFQEWRKLFLISLCPVICGAILLPLYPDSIFYYITEEKYKEAIDIGELYFKKFDKEEEFINIMNETGNIKHESTTDSICNNILILSIAFFNAYSLQGIKYILPKTLEFVFSNQDNQIGTELTISSVLNGCSSFLTGILIENSFFQRLRLMKVVILFSVIMSFSAYIIKDLIDIFACILRASVGMHDQILEIYSAESFKTKHRVFFLGLYNIIQSVSSFMSPLVNDIIISHSYNLNYFVFGVILSFLTILACFLQKEKFKILIT